MMSAVAALDWDFPANNARFLDGLVAAVLATTGIDDDTLVYGAMNCGRMLRDVAAWTRVMRRPGTRRSSR
ncbi:hypothetical protein [Paraburkholderia strydomiana]|uniref:hypothetical protein n=1 Tax=Paraburkholderia strydomiana TaxID=1245417 RepID=UPI001BEB28A4|nr:hypothetical protein [Paraburkholderia strydomiana]MBT2792844.1 hypothetical protein [Paraburkholderia strydomiana]